MKDPETTIRNLVRESLHLKEQFFDENAQRIIAFRDLLLKTRISKKKVLIFGNGGSAADAQHFAAELMHRVEHLPLNIRAFALHTDSSLISAISNDEGFNHVFSKQVEILGEENDLAVAITTSGNSTNVLNGLQSALAKKCTTVGMLGRDGGKALPLCDLAFLVKHKSTPRIQEVHGMLIHLVCQLLEESLR